MMIHNLIFIITISYIRIFTVSETINYLRAISLCQSIHFQLMRLKP